MLLLNRTEFVERLKDNIVQVNFTKVNGENRDMLCTLDPNLIPCHFDVDEYVKTDHKEQFEETGRMNVWDVEANGWRSFRLETVNFVLTPAPERA